MREIPLKSFVVKAGPEGEGNVVHVEVKNDSPAHVELQVIGGGPVFLFRGSMTAKECYALLHGQTDFPHYLLAAVPGQAAYCTLEANPGPLTAFSDQESIGHIRAIGVSK